MYSARALSRLPWRASRSSSAFFANPSSWDLNSSVLSRSNSRSRSWIAASDRPSACRRWRSLSSSSLSWSSNSSSLALILVSTLAASWSFSLSREAMRSWMLAISRSFSSMRPSASRFISWSNLPSAEDSSTELDSVALSRGAKMRVSVKRPAASTTKPTRLTRIGIARPRFLGLTFQVSGPERMRLDFATRSMWRRMSFWSSLDMPEAWSNTNDPLSARSEPTAFLNSWAFFKRLFMRFL